MNRMKSRAIIVVVLLVVLGGLFLTGNAESHVCYPETRVGVRSQNFTPDFEKAAPQNPDYTSLEQFLTDSFTSSTLVIQKEMDSTDLAYFGARYYDPTSGRFTNPDPFMGHLTDPRSQFLYGYGFNNPLRFVDPDGSRVIIKEVLKGLILDTPIEIGNVFVDAGVILGVGIYNSISDNPLHVEDVPFASSIGNRAKNRLLESQSQEKVAGKGVVEILGAILTGGYSAQCQGYDENITSVLNGEITIDEAERNLSRQLGNALSVMFTGAGFAKSTTGSWTGTPQTPILRPNLPRNNPVLKSQPPAITQAEPPINPKTTAITDPSRLLTAGSTKSTVIQGSGGLGKVYEIPASELKAGKPYIGKTRRAVSNRMADKDHRLKTPTGKPPKSELLAENLTLEEAAGLEALIAQERGLENLSNKIKPLDPSLKKNELLSRVVD